MPLQGDPRTSHLFRTFPAKLPGPLSHNCSATIEHSFGRKAPRDARECSHSRSFLPKWTSPRGIPDQREDKSSLTGKTWLYGPSTINAPFRNEMWLILGAGGGKWLILDFVFFWKTIENKTERTQTINSISRFNAPAKPSNTWTTTKHGHPILTIKMATLLNQFIHVWFYIGPCLIHVWFGWFMFDSCLVWVIHGGRQQRRSPSPSHDAAMCCR